MARMLVRAIPFFLAIIAAVSCAKQPASPATKSSPPREPAWRSPDRREALVTAPIGSGASVPGIALLDSSASRVFVVGSAGQLDVLDATTGEARFTTGLAAAPMFLFGDAVAVLDGGRRVALIDRADGRVLFTSAPTGIPSGEAIDRVTSANGVLSIEWHTVHHPNLACCGGGIPTTTVGSVRIDLRSGVATPGKTAQHPGDHFAPSTSLPAPAAPPLLVLSYDEQILRPDGFMTRHRSIRATDASGRERWRHSIPSVTYDARPRPNPGSP